jgi:hypothetical protein
VDYKDQTHLNRDEQYAGHLEEAFGAQILGRLKDLHTCLPGIVQSFDAAKQTAVVQPAIQRIFTNHGPVNLPVCVDVPVAFPGGGGFYLTFPVKAGDECILLFSERAIDNWYASGGTQQPYEFRLHDLSDGIAIVGLNSQPHRLSSVQSTGAELRTRDRSCYLRLEAGAIYIKGNLNLDGDLVHTGNSTITGSITAQGDTTLTGKITATDDIMVGSKSLKSHTHTDPQGGVTGTPN